MVKAPALRRVILSFACSLLVTATACTGSDSDAKMTSSSTADKNHHELQILVQMRVFQPATDDSNKFRSSTTDNDSEAPIPGALVSITSRGQELWTGETDALGRVQASFDAHAKWTVRVKSDLLVKDIVSPGHPVQPSLNSMDVATKELYELMPEKR